MFLSYFSVYVNNDISHTGLSPDMVSVLIIMSVLAVDICLILREFLRIVPYTISFEEASFLSHIGDFLFKSNPHYSARIIDI